MPLVFYYKNNIDEILYLLSDIPNVYIQILSNMILFRKSYIELLKSGKLYINTSIDSRDKNL